MESILSGRMRMNTDNELRVFAENVAYLRKKHGYSRRKMAQLLNTSSYTIAQLESGTVPRRLGASFLLRITDVFGIRPEAMLKPLDGQ